MNAQIFRNVLVAGSLLGAFGAAADAQTARTVYHRYEVTTLEGQRAVLARISRAAKRACGADGTLEARLDSKRCTAEMTAQMVTNTRNSALAALWKGNNVQLASRGR